MRLRRNEQRDRHTRGIGDRPYGPSFGLIETDTLVQPVPPLALDLPAVHEPGLSKDLQVVAAQLVRNVKRDDQVTNASWLRSENLQDPQPDRRSGDRREIFEPDQQLELDVVHRPPLGGGQLEDADAHVVR